MQKAAPKEAPYDCRVKAPDFDERYTGPRLENQLLMNNLFELQKIMEPIQASLKERKHESNY
jgi:hypothetical protein